MQKGARRSGTAATAAVVLAPAATIFVVVAVAVALAAAARNLNKSRFAVILLHIKTLKVFKYSFSLPSCFMNKSYCCELL